MKKILAAAAIGGALFAGSLGLADTASASPVRGYGNCDVVPWGFLGLTQKRLICDGAIQADGSWWRHRIQYVPAHYVNPSSSCTGGRYSSYCTYYEGGYVDDDIRDDETYMVTPDTIVPGEPGHLG